MTRPKINSVPQELREKIVSIAMETDCIALYKLDSWREAAVCSARWLLRVAALADDHPKGLRTVFRQVATLCDKLRGSGISNTEADELLNILEMYNGPHTGVSEIYDKSL